LLEIRTTTTEQDVILIRPPLNLPLAGGDVKIVVGYRTNNWDFSMTPSVSPP